MTKAGGSLDEMLDALAAANAAQAQTQALLQLGLEAAAMAAWRWDIGAPRVQWLAGMEHILGPRPAGDWPDFRDMVHEDDRQRYLQTGRRVIEGIVDHYACSFRIRRSDGCIRHVQALGRLLRGPHGQPLALVGVTLDETEVRQALERLAASENFARQLFEANPVALLLVDDAGIVQHANAWAHWLFGYADLRGISVEELVPHAAGDIHRDHRRHLRLDGNEGYRTRATRALTRDTRELPVRVTLAAVPCDGQQLVLAAVHDMSEEDALRDELVQQKQRLADEVRQRTAELERARAQAERLAQVKS